MAAQIIHYHLEEAGRGPMKMSDTEENVAVVDEEGENSRPPQTARHGETPHDKIVLFFLFTDSLWLVNKALRHHGIESVMLTGDTKAPERTKTLATFRKSTTINVILVSSVAIAGLDLWFCRVLVIMVSVGGTYINMDVMVNYIIQDCLWSAAEDAQLKGRLARLMQLQWVLVYRIIARDTPDVFLNNISFGKARMLAEFTKTSAEMRE